MRPLPCGWLALALASSAALLQACGGGGDAAAPSPVAAASAAQPPVVDSSPAPVTGGSGGDSGSSGGTNTALATVTLGGTVRGLTDAGLVLFNGSEQLTVGASAISFAFPTLLVPRTLYSVGIQTQPASGATVCGVANGDGIAGVASSLPIVVTCVPTPWTVSTLAGSGSAGSDDGSGSAASFDSPWGLGVGADGSVYVADTLNHKLRKISPAGLVTTLAGSGLHGSANGTGSAADFYEPSRVLPLPNGTMLVADSYNQRIRLVTSAGVVSTWAGSGAAGAADGPAASASFSFPIGLALAADGSVYVADNANHLIRKVAADGTVSTVAGTGVAGFADGVGRAASFNGPFGVAVDANGVVYVADALNHRIRKITPAGVVSTLAGSGTRGSADGRTTQASFAEPQGVTVAADGTLYVADTSNHTIRRVDPAGVVTTIVGKAGTAGAADGAGGVARLNFPFDVAIGPDGALYVADWGNHKLRKLNNR